MSGDLPALIEKCITQAHARAADRPALIGIGGAQGSGKSYQCRAYAAAHAGVAHFSLDDVYLSKAARIDLGEIWRDVFLRDSALPHELPHLSDAERRRIADRTLPLFETRGRPGTHDLGLAGGLIARLRTPALTPLPRFDKARDEAAPEETWPRFQGPAAAILIDGWCMGALAPDFSAPLNAVEAQDEARALYFFTTDALEHEYARFFDAFDALIYLQAPSWEIVRIWRGQQEEETLGRPLTADENAALDRFVMHYERVTRAMLAGHHRADWIVHFDEARNVVRVEER